MMSFALPVDRVALLDEIVRLIVQQSTEMTDDDVQQQPVQHCCAAELRQ